MEPVETLHFWTEAEVAADFRASVYVFALRASQIWPDYKFGYALGTEQFWVLDDKAYGISYYGMTVETSIGFEPYRVMLGGIEMGGYASFYDALIEMTTRLRNTIALAVWHMEAVGKPCNYSCDCSE